MTAPTSETTPTSPPLLRHIVPVLAGGIVTLLLTVATNGMVATHGALPVGNGPMIDTRTLLLVTGYRALFSVVGCHLASRLAPSGNPRIRYAVALGMLLLVLNVAGAVSNRGQVPLWYSLVAIALTIPCAIVGGATAVRVIERRRLTSNAN